MSMTRRAVAMSLMALGGGHAYAENRAFVVAVPAGLPAWMDIVVDDLANDLNHALEVPVMRAASTSARADLRLQISQDAAHPPSEHPGDLAKILPGDEAFVVHSVRDGQGHRTLLIASATPEGLRRGVYAFCRHALAVDPTYHFTDLPRPKKSLAQVKAFTGRDAGPAFRHRGWFVNDEDLLTEWAPPSGKRFNDYPFYNDVPALSTVDQVAETAARLGMNFIIPASLVNIFNPDEAALLDTAQKRGLAVSQHHVEPVGVSAFTYKAYWKAKGQDPLFSFWSERERMIEVWAASIERWSRRDTIWALGLRGAGDRPLWLSDPSIPRDDATVGRLISDAIATQRALIRKANPDKPQTLTTVMWAEGAALLAGGHLEIPDDVTVIFSDNSPGAKMQADFAMPRAASKTYGVYYHQQLWSSGPHLAQAVPPRVTRQVIDQVRRTGANTLALVNCSNVREFTLGLTLLSDQLNLSTASSTIVSLCSAWYGKRHGPTVAGLYDQLFAAYVTDPGDPTRQLFLDGHLKQMGTRLIGDLNGGQTTGHQAPREDTDAVRLWAAKSLSSMLAVEPSGENLALLRTQQVRFQRTAAAARAVLPHLPARQSALLKSNILAQAELMAGLSDWVLELARARGENARSGLENALRAIEKANAAKALAAEGRFADWYRGDRKMNIGGLVAATAQRLAALG